ncbi:hypothetical protein SO694_0000407 [Aureococcus anophagefferens]|uniref:Uncharacterized protein n=1 Tax=Aureococcus anophagefferens TaxID=44056 RepID=A0ABR1G941_AURAN
MKRVLLLVVSIRTIDAGACYNATANAALLRQGAALQCAGAATKMPCLDLQRPTLPPRLFHLHLSKMNGRSVLDRAPGVTGLPRCPWTRSSGGTSSTLRRKGDGAARPAAVGRGHAGEPDDGGRSRATALLAPRRAAAGTSLVGLATMAAELAILAGLVAASL